MSRVHLRVIDHFLNGSHTLSLGCRACPLLSECGGYARASAAWSCMDECAKCDKATCKKVCLQKPNAFVGDLMEVHGFGFEDVPPLLQRVEPMPHYVPVIQHGYVRAEPIETPWAAVTLESLMLARDGVYGPSAVTQSELRTRYRLGPQTKLALLGTGPDNPIERFWEQSRESDVVAALAALRFDFAVVPNYSLFLQHPRPDHLFNRKRSLICAREWSQAGIPTTPYLQAATAYDWTFWDRFLFAHPEVTIVAKEFQTGLGRRDRGLLALGHLARLQDRLGRSLHVVAIGGAQYRDELKARFAHWTVIDSTPFMKMAKRRVAERVTRERVVWRRATELSQEVLLNTNILRYAEWVGM